MVVSNRDRISQGLDLLVEGLRPFIRREMEAAYGPGWTIVKLNLYDPRDHAAIQEKGVDALDAGALLDTMWKEWNEVFRKTLGFAERSVISELKTVRNEWAHQKPFDLNRTIRALDSVRILLEAVGAPKQAAAVQEQYEAVLLARQEEVAKQRQRKAAKEATESRPSGGLRPWREVIEPHPDVQKGEYGKSEFAVDLNQVHHGIGTTEYRDPATFFQRTFLTEGLKRLLVSGIRRLAGHPGGDPVIQLQTNFGGGKTHSMLAMYHAVSGKSASELPGMEEVLKAAGLEKLPTAQRAVFVGTAHGVSDPDTPEPGVELRTIWGRIAYQLAGKQGYELVKKSDQDGTAPGSNRLIELFNLAGTSLILIDEWVAFVRHAYEKDGLPCGSFDANLTFVQNLTEAVKSHPRTLLLASLPESNLEAGGEGGVQALARVQNTFGRVEANWQPATTEETFRIVRQRLFQPLSPEGAKDRDAVVAAFMSEYAQNRNDYPSSVQQMEYRHRMQAAYPVHPEVFDRLYSDWGTVAKFQRTRGVLRFMATVIRELWARGDRNLLIMPGTIPFDEPDVYTDLFRHLEDRGWTSVLETDVDGENAKALRLDRDIPAIGKLSAGRRVARTIFLPSPATHRGSNKGLDKQHVLLGCVQPGESSSTFGDALRRLTETSNFLYNDRSRYWYSLTPSAARIAADIAAGIDDPHADEAIRKRLLQYQKDKRDFKRVHACPTGPADVDDAAVTGIVILGPEVTHTKDSDSSAKRLARRILDERGNTNRTYRNTLLFLAIDHGQLEGLRDAARMHEAWADVLDRKDALRLDKLQETQAEDQEKRSNQTFEARLLEAYKWLLAPRQDKPDPNAKPEERNKVHWDELPIRGGQDFLGRVAEKAKAEVFFTTLAGHALRLHLDQVPLWRGDAKDHVELDQLAEDFARYLYLPRLASPDVLLNGIRQCTTLVDTTGSVALADGYDVQKKRFLNLRVNTHSGLQFKAGVVIVHPEAAERQLRAETGATPTLPRPNPAGPEGVPGGTTPHGDPTRGGALAPTPLVQARRFYLAKELDPLTPTEELGKIVANVLQHLVAAGGKPRITLNVEVDLPNGVTDSTKRTVKENCRTLKLEDADFLQD